MFVRTKRTGANEYLQIVQNYREGYKTKQRLIGTLGRVDEVVGSKDIDTLISKLSKYSKEALMVITGQSKIDASSVSIGPALIFERIWNELGMPGIIHKMTGSRKFAFDVERAIFLTVMHRLLASGSDRSCEKWKRDYHIERTEAIALHQLYRAMGFLGEEIEDQKDKTPFSPRCNKDIIEERLFDRRADLFSALDLVFFDTTSIYFEGLGGDELGCLGHSKDHRPDLNQMVVGAILDGNGDPICCELWPGNTSDVKTLLPITDRIKNRFGVSQFCVVADRGMISEDTLAGLEEREISFILGVRMRNQKLVREEVLSRAGRFEEVRQESEVANDPHPLKVKEVMAGGKRYIVCFNERQARKDAADRQAIIESLEEKIANSPKSLVGNKGYGRYLKITRGTFKIDKKKVDEDRRFDGKWVLQTNTNFASPEVALKYKELWMVEQVFRDVKSILTTRPIFHKMDETIRGHVFCSFLALVLRKELDKRLEKLDMNYQWNDIKQDLTALREVILTEDQSKLSIRTACRGICADVFKAVGVAIPPTIRSLT
jgi:transposase